MLRDILRGDPQVAAVVAVIAAVRPDILLLTGVDYDHDGVALAAFEAQLAEAEMPYPHRFAARPNTGMATGLDLDGDGFAGDASDAQGFGRFAGEGGMAVFSRLPIRVAEVRDFSSYLWRDLPGALLPDGMTTEVAAVQRLSTTAHWDVPVGVPGGVLHLLAWHASPPVFDGPEDRNGRRNHDEAAFWLRLLEGALPFPAPPAPFVLLGDANLDPVDGEGLPAALTSLLTHPLVQDVAPRSNAGRAEPTQLGDPALDTADFSANAGPGGLRVDYVLPSAGLKVTASGVFWPAPGDPMRAVAEAASRHRLVWVDVTLP